MGPGNNKEGRLAVRRTGKTGCVKCKYLTPSIFLSGFGPFGSARVNSSEVLVRALATDRQARRWIAGVKVLPVEFDRCFEVLRPALRKSSPDALICFGLNVTASAIELETVARNRNLVRGRSGKVVHKTIIRNAPARLQTRLPIRFIARVLRRGGYRCAYSKDAGGYVCNNLFFHVLRGCLRGMPCGFIHVPAIGGKGWTRARLVGAGRRIVRAVAEDLQKRPA